MPPHAQFPEAAQCITGQNHASRIRLNILRLLKHDRLDTNELGYFCNADCPKKTVFKIEKSYLNSMTSQKKT